MEGEDSTTPPVGSPDDGTVSPTQTSRPAKRSRVALACQRCKQRKQKCNGEQPSCAKCSRLNIQCHYVMPTYPKPGQVKIYIKALEDRVAELETILTREGNKNVSDDHWAEQPIVAEEEESQGDIQPLLNAVRDLSLDVVGSYVGGSSTITLGRALESALGGKIQYMIPEAISEQGERRSRASFSDALSPAQSTGIFALGQLDPEDADKMVNAYLGHLYTNYPIMYSYEILELHSRRHNLRDVYEESILNLIYGLGGHFLEKTGDTSGSYFPERHYEIALDNRETILRYGDTRSLTYLLLLGQHCLRMPKDPGAWTFIGLAMKMCIELGLHRRRRYNKITLTSEINKRKFWSCYAWDREISIAIGRPPSISDHDIDVELPLDVNEANRSVEALQQAADAKRTGPAFPQTTLTCHIHLLRLKKLESEIQHDIYRVDAPKSQETVYAATDLYLKRLYAWKDAIPPQSTEWDPTNRHKFRGDEYASYDSYMASYHKAIRLLLQPRLYETVINRRYLDLCAEACRGVCQTYKSLLYKMPLVFTSVSLQTVFLAGLTLVYCMWHDSSNANGFKGFGALSDCSIILYVMTEKWPAGKRYRDLFESVKKAVLDAISEEKHIPRTAVTTMKEQMHTSLKSLQVNTATECVRDDLEQMISDMTGGSVGMWDDGDLEMSMEMNNDTDFSGRLGLPAGLELGVTEWEPSDGSVWFDNGYQATWTPELKPA